MSNKNPTKIRGLGKSLYTKLVRTSQDTVINIHRVQRVWGGLERLGGPRGILGRAQRDFGGAQGDGTLRNASPRDDTSGAGHGHRASVGMDGEVSMEREHRYIYIYIK